MSRNEDFDNATWDKPEFFALTPPAKLVYIWSFTNTRCHFSGIYQVNRQSIALETGHDDETVRDALVECEQARFLFYDGSWLWVRTRVKRINTRTVQMCKAVAKDLAKVPHDHPYRGQLLETEGSRVWQSKDARTTIKAEMEYLSGETREGHGSDGVSFGASRFSGSHPTPTSVGALSGTGTGKGTSQGRGAGRGRGTRPELAPSPKAVAETQARREREVEFCALFPDIEPSMVMFTARELNRVGEVATVEAVRARLEAA